MIGWAGSAETLWRATFWVLVHGTILAALAYLLSRTLLRGARPAVIAALWTLVLVKFVVPVGPAMPWSLSSLIDRVVGSGGGETIVVATPTMTSTSSAAHAATLSTRGAIALAAAALWALAFTVLIVRRVREQMALRAQARAGVLADTGPGSTTALVAAAAQRLGLRRTPEIRVDDSTSPWVIGLGRAILVLPRAMVAGNRAELTAVVSHELAHLRRRDAWLRLVQVVAGSLFFFWPVVRWANRRADAARELACDAWAIERGPLAAHDYARVLVRLVRARVPSPALAFAAHPAQLGARVDALLTRRGLRAGLGKPGAALLAGWALLALGGASRAEARTPAPRVHCTFSPELAAEMLVAYPQADADGDGQLTRDEACIFQLELQIVATELAETSPMAEESLCCNCGEIEATSSVLRAVEPPNACPQE